MSDEVAPAEPPEAHETPEGDEKPNMARMVGLFLLLIGMSGYLYYVRVLHPPPVRTYDVVLREIDVPGLQASQVHELLQDIDVSGLSEAQLHTLLQVTRNTPCGCGLKGCTMNLAECRYNDHTCHTSLGKVNTLVADLRAGRPLTTFQDTHVPSMPGPAVAPSAAPVKK